MKTLTRCGLAVCAAIAALGWRAPRADWESAHWTVTRETQGGSLGIRPQATYEIWMKGDKALIEHPGVGSDELRILIDGNTTYGWRVGQPKGLKYDSPSTDERTMFIPSIDYMLKAAPCRATGKKGNTGTFDGHPFVRYDCDASDGTHRVYYYATDLQGFPLHATITYPDHTIVIYDARKIEVPAVIAAGMLQVPAGVTFEPGPS
jgi:hypothetical protein